MTEKQLQLAQEIEQKFRELQETIDGDKYITAYIIGKDFSIGTSTDKIVKNKFRYFNGKEVFCFGK